MLAMMDLRPLANNAYEPLDFEWVVKKNMQK